MQFTFVLSSFQFSLDSGTPDGILPELDSVGEVPGVETSDQGKKTWNSFFPFYEYSTRRISFRIILLWDWECGSERISFHGRGQRKWILPHNGTFTAYYSGRRKKGMGEGITYEPLDLNSNYEFWRFISSAASAECLLRSPDSFTRLWSFPGLDKWKWDLCEDHLPPPRLHYLLDVLSLWWEFRTRCSV